MRVMIAKSEDGVSEWCLLELQGAVEMDSDQALSGCNLGQLTLNGKARNTIWVSINAH